MTISLMFLWHDVGGGDDGKCKHGLGSGNGASKVSTKEQMMNVTLMILMP